MLAGASSMQSIVCPIDPQVRHMPRPGAQQGWRTCRCAFRNCQHLQEPGCAVRGNWPRHAWYAELHGELTAAEDLARHRSASKIKRQGTARVKTQAGGNARREALLNPKSHRRVNRKQVGRGVGHVQVSMIVSRGQTGGLLSMLLC